MVKHGKKTSGTDLVNFHFSSSPPSHSMAQEHHQRRRTSTRPQQHHNRAQYRRSEQDRASARRKAASAMFYLHSSADHAFVITRRAKQGGYSFCGPDVAVPWGAVRSVKYLVPSTDRDSEATCPICLHSFTCARITKCGHCFCLPCLLRHVHSQTETQTSQAVKCPCCSLPIHIDDFRLVTLESVLTPKVQSRIKLIKLHRTKDCPAPYLPQREACKHSSPHTAPMATDLDSAFCRFNYVDPEMYQSQLAHNQTELESELAVLQRHPHPSTEMDALVLQISLENVKHEQQRAVEELEEEKELMQRYSGSNTGMYQPLPKHLFAPDMSTTIPSRASEESGGADIESEVALKTRDRGFSMDAGDLSVESTRRQRGGSMGSADDTRRSERRERHLPPLPSTMYLEEGSTQFYQSTDGQLCFLSKFNMSCLLAEFSAHAPDSTVGVESMSIPQRRKLQPLPDEIDGTILEIENIHLTPELRKRMPFLSHLPVYTDIAFVELDLNPILSDSTRNKFRAEFEKRRKKRKSKVTTEKKADRLARKEEERRIEELKARIQRIDPNDDFFQAPAIQAEPLTGEDFGPSLIAPPPATGEPADAPSALAQSPPLPNPALSFSAVAGRGFSVLNPAGMTEEEAFPSLVSSNQTGETPSTEKPAATTDLPLPRGSFGSTPGKTKKSKGKKVVLFSTGGHRGAGS